MTDREPQGLILLEPARSFEEENETAWLLNQGLRLMHSAGGSSQREYAHVIRLLRANGPAAADAAAGVIDAAEEDLMLRWSVLYVIADVEDDACLGLLRAEATRPLPGRSREPGVCEQPVDYEEMLLVMAIEGLSRLAEAGNAEATGALLEVVERQDRRSLRRPAAAAVVAAQPELRGHVEELMGENDRFLLDLRDATLEDLSVEVTQEDLARNPNRREAAPRLVLSSPESGTPQVPCGEGREFR